MDQKLSVFSEDSAKLIKSVVEEYLRRNRSKYQTHWQEENRDTIFAPEVYIAEVPAGGIPALTRTTVAETGTGSETTCRYIPGSATCNIYKIQVSYTAETGTGTGYTEVIELVDAEFDKTVYNVSTTAIAGTSAAVSTGTGTASATGTSTTSCTKLFVVVKRDKYGKWLAEQSGSSAGHDVISFKVLASGPFYSEIDIFCLRMRCEVVDVSANASGVAVGDEVDVWDPDGAFFSIPVPILINCRGTAVSMAWHTAQTEVGGLVNRGISGDCFRDSTQEEVDALSYAGECWWLVTGLSCTEEWYDSGY